MEARSIFLLRRRFYLFVNLVRFLLFFFFSTTYKLRLHQYHLSLFVSHCDISSVVLEQIERHFNVYTHDTILPPSLFFRNSFGKRTPHTQHRINECVVLEPSEMLVVSSASRLSQQGHRKTLTEDECLYAYHLSPHSLSSGRWMSPLVFMLFACNPSFFFFFRFARDRLIIPSLSFPRQITTH